MATEDFAYYLDRVPGCLLRLGLASTGPACTARFDFNGQSNRSGITLFVSLALGYNKVRASSMR